MDLRLWALAFTVLDWTERQKAECWAALQADAQPKLSTEQAAALARLEADLPRRNWLLAAWTDGVLVTEARLKSGSLVTARLALDLGKELWVCPGSPEDPSAEGPNALLREGAARICLSPMDLLTELDPARVT